MLIVIRFVIAFLPRSKHLLDSVLKCKDITLPAKVHIFTLMVFPVVMCRCECWTIKKAEYQKIDAFKLWCWKRLLRVSWTARRSSSSILKEINPEYSLEGLRLKLKLQWEQMKKINWNRSIRKDLDVGKD